MSKRSLRLVALGIVVMMAATLWILPGSAVQAQAKKYRVGLVYDVGGRGDLSFNDMAYAGLARAQKQFGA
ncbi:MAG TPA: BMP family ABC transporter substrate-binding protein, partial [bacterium]|nr:BMP family ABC transporter substrate-binding protein [bacterium]